MATLSKDFLSVLRKADVVSFHYERSQDAPDWSGAGRTEIVATIRGKGDLVDPEVKAVLSCESTVLRVYTSDGGEDARGSYTNGFYMVGSAQYRPEWVTIVSLLRAGDDITFDWAARMLNNQYMDRAKLFGDSLTMRVVRGKRTMVFSVGESICPDNSARMLRRGRWNERAA